MHPASHTDNSATSRNKTTIRHAHKNELPYHPTPNNAAANASSLQLGVWREACPSSGSITIPCGYDANYRLKGKCSQYKHMLYVTVIKNRTRRGKIIKNKHAYTYVGTNTHSCPSLGQPLCWFHVRAGRSDPDLRLWETCSCGYVILPDGRSGLIHWHSRHKASNLQTFRGPRTWPGSDRNTGS